MATLANLNVLVGANTKGFTKGLRDADRKTRSFARTGGEQMKRFGSSAASAASRVVNLRSSIAVLAGSAGIGLLVSRQMEAIGSTANFADMIGEGTKELVGLQHAAEMTAGVTDSQFNTALQRMTRRVAEAAQGTGEAKDAIRQLGLDAQALNDMGPAAAFQAISAAMQDVDNQGERVRLAFKLFDSEGVKLVNTLNAGPDAIRELVDEADRLGIAYDRVDAAKVEAANDAITRAQGAFAGVARTLTFELSPYIEAVANHIAEASAESRGFKNEIIAGTESMAMGVGYLGNTFRGLHVVWKGLEVAFAGIAEGIWNTFDMLIGGIDTGMSKLPFVGDKFGGVADLLGAITENATARTRELQAEFDELIMRPMPAGQVEAFFDSIRKNADEAAQKVAESRNNMTGGVVGGDSDATGVADNEALQNKLARIQESTLAENELLIAKHEQQRAIVAEAFEAGLVDEQERKALLEQLEERHQSKLLAIEEKGLSDIEKLKRTSWNNQTQTVLGNMADMTAGVAQGNRAMFEINKVAALAEGALSLKKTVMDAYEWGTAVGGPWTGAAYAAIAGAAQVANLAQIANTSFGAGGAAPSVGGTAAPPVTPVGGEIREQEEERGRTQRIYVEFEGSDDQNIPLREFRQQIRRLKEENPDAELVF